MPSFSKASDRELATSDMKLQRVANVAIRFIDFKVLEGFRNQERQNQMFEEGKSKLLWPEGKHNTLPSLAFDLAPYPIIWPTPQMKKDNPSKYVKAICRFYLLAGVIMTVAWMLGIKLRWGGDWDGDWDVFDQRFDDLGHFEVIDDAE